jgi:predicted dehydrogenase
MSTRKYRVAVIGRTGRGNYGHGLDVVWKHFPNTQIVAIADDNAQGLAKAGERLQVRALYADYQKMLREERPDIVAVAPRWVDCHQEMVIAATEARASIYMEKPMARTLAEADTMIDACDRAHVKLAVAHQMRVSPILDHVRQQLKEGFIGQLEEMRGRGKEDRRAGGEDLMVLGTHVMDLMRQFAGNPDWAFGNVQAAGRDITKRDAVEGPEGLGLIAGDSISASFAFRNGVMGYFGSKRTDEASGLRFGLDLYGSRGVMSIRAGMEPAVHICASKNWTEAAWTRLMLPGEPTQRDTKDANRAVVADLLDAIEKDRPPKASGVEARWTIEMVLAIYASHLERARIKLPLQSRTHPLAG